MTAGNMTRGSDKCTLPATKRSLVDSTASSNASVKRKAKKNKEEENGDKHSFIYLPLTRNTTTVYKKCTEDNIQNSN